MGKRREKESRNADSFSTESEAEALFRRIAIQLDSAEPLHSHI